MRQLPDIIDAFMQYTNNSEPPILYRKWTAVSMVAACLQRRVHALFSGPLFPNLYIVLVGPAGKCRKGTAMRPAIALLRKAGVKLCDEAITREALFRELRRQSRQYIDPITKLPRTHSSLSVFSEELTVFMGYNQLQFMADLCNLYDCGDTFTFRCKDPTKTDEVVGVWLNLLGGTTPTLLRTTMPLDAVGGGLTTRMIFVFEQTKAKTVLDPWRIDYPEDLPKKIEYDLDALMRLVGRFKYAEDFIAVETESYAQQEAKAPIDDPNFSGYIARRRVMLLKMSMVMSASRSDDMILMAKDFDRAKELLEATERKMPMTFRGVGRNRLADIQHKVMVDIGLAGSIWLSQLSAKYISDATKDEMVTIAQSLAYAGFCKAEFSTDRHDYYLSFIPENGEGEEDGMDNIPRH